MKENKWLSMKEVCVYLGINRDNVLNRIKREGIPAHEKRTFMAF